MLSLWMITAKLNIAGGSDPSPVEDAMAAADVLLGAYPDGLPCGVRPSTKAGRLMIGLTHELESYNSGRLTLDCE